MNKNNVVKSANPPTVHATREDDLLAGAARRDSQLRQRLAQADPLRLLVFELGGGQRVLAGEALLNLPRRSATSCI